MIVGYTLAEKIDGKWIIGIWRSWMLNEFVNDDQALHEATEFRSLLQKDTRFENGAWIGVQVKVVPLLVSDEELQ
jgi:hypothetical protein